MEQWVPRATETTVHLPGVQNKNVSEVLSICVVLWIVWKLNKTSWTNRQREESNKWKTTCSLFMPVLNSPKIVNNIQHCLGKPQKNSSTNGQAIKRGGGKGRVIKEKKNFLKTKINPMAIRLGLNGLAISRRTFLRLPLVQ